MCNIAIDIFFSTAENVTLKRIRNYGKEQFSKSFEFELLIGPGKGPL